MKRTLVGLLLVCALGGSAFAQGGGPANTVPYGQGPGRSFGSMGPGTSGYAILGNGAGSAPSFQGFLQSGTGATTRTWQDKAREVFSVKDFGAVGDGVTDDTTAVSNARAAAGGNVLLFPKGTYLINNTTALGIAVSGLEIRGEGWDTVIKAKNSADLGTLIAGFAGITYTIRDITLDGNKANGGMDNDAGSYILYMQGDDCKVENVQIQNAQRVGLGVVNTYRGYRILNSYFHNNEIFGLTNVGAGANPNDVVIAGNSFIDNYITPIGDSAAALIFADNLRIYGNYFRNNYNITGGQISIGGTGGSFSNNVIVQTGTVPGETTFGLEVNSSDFVISSNYISGTTGAGINLQSDSVGVVVRDNAIRTTTASAIASISSGAVTGPTRVSIIGNHIMAASNAAGAIAIQPGAPNHTIAHFNYIDPSITTPFAGVFASRFGNYGTGVSTAGAVSVDTAGVFTSGTLSAANGGTGQPAYSVGDILYASASATLAKLNGVATGNSLISGGVNTAPSWGKIGLTTHVSGVLPVANGGIGGATGSVDNAAIRADGTGGSAIQSSALVIADTTAALSRSGGGGVPIQATNTNDSAASGDYGQYTSGSTATTSLSTTVSTNIHTLTSLAAGEWDVQCVAKFNPAGTTTIQDLVVEVSTNNAPALDLTIGNYTRMSDITYTASTRAKVFSTPVVRISLSASTNVYCHGYAEFGVSTMTADGFMRARRPR